MGWLTAAWYCLELASVADVVDCKTVLFIFNIVGKFPGSANWIEPMIVD